MPDYDSAVATARSTVGGLPCVFCGTPSTRNGEHVWPSWFLSSFQGGEPGFHLEVNGVPQLKRDGTLRTTPSLPGTRVPMCAPCNGELDRRFERPAKNLVRDAKVRKVDERWKPLSADDVRSVVLWALKVGLLSKHPSAVFDDPVMNEQTERWDVADHALFDWLRDGSPPPADLTVFASWASKDVATAPVGTLIVPERIVTDAGAFVSRIVSFGVLDIHLDVLYHPQQSVIHPLVPDIAVVALPGPANGAELQALVPHHPSDLRIVLTGTVVLAPGVVADRLPPVTVDTSVFTLLTDGLASSVSM